MSNMRKLLIGLASSLLTTSVLVLVTEVVLQIDLPIWVWGLIGGIIGFSFPRIIDWLGRQK